ncbi:MAG TPA: hypothetical protein V6D15_16050 [Oculatellaceae cyanobacterium]|jgi:hypothetical protein
MTLTTEKRTVKRQINLTNYCKGWADFFQLMAPKLQNEDYLRGWEEARVVTMERQQNTATN